MSNIKFPPIFLTLFSAFFCFGSLAIAQDVQDIDDKTKACRTQGFTVLYAWYGLEPCMQFQKIKPEVALNARNSVTAAYPKLKAEIDADSPFAKYSREAGTTWSPYKFNDSQNTESLINICKTQADFLHVAASREDWQTTLACWR